MLEPSSATQNLLAKYDAWQQSLAPNTDVPTIHVDEVALKIAAFYEQLRTIVDWKEEHLMRRAAIIRKLKRRFFDLEMSNFSVQDTAEALILELIRGGYFPNDKIEESKIGEAQNIINKYAFIFKHNPEHKQGKSGLQFYNHLLEIAACEIEETLDPAIKEMALIEYMFSQMQERIRVSETIYERQLLKPEDKDIQIYIAVQQSLFKLDDPIISYNLLRYKYPEWENPTEEQLTTLSANMYAIWIGIMEDLSCPLGKKFYTICEKYDTAYLLIGDILSRENPGDIERIFSDPALLETSVRKAYQKRLKDLTSKITRAAIYSTISIFITKILSLFIIEIVLAKLFSQPLNSTVLGIDILIPTVLMCILVLAVKPPSKNNINIVVMEVMKIVYKKDKLDIYEIKPARKRGPVTKTILSLTYVLGAFVSFGALYLIFSYFNFPISSIIIDMVFIALILFAGTAVQKRSRELTIEDEKGGFFMFVSDVLFLPITGVGRWLSNTWKQYNAITAFFNALIDMPFSVFIEFLERWRYFIKDTKEDLR